MAPLINKQLIVYLEGSTDDTSWCGPVTPAGPPCEMWMLALLVLGLYASQLVSGAIRSYTEFQAKRMAMHCYAALTKAIYDKSLRLSSSVCAGSGGTGKLVNMMSSDANNSMERSVFLLLPVLVAPFQLIVYFVLIYQEVRLGGRNGLLRTAFHVWVFVCHSKTASRRTVMKPRSARCTGRLRTRRIQRWLRRSSCSQSRLLFSTE